MAGSRPRTRGGVGGCFFLSAIPRSTWRCFFCGVGWGWGGGWGWGRGAPRERVFVTGNTKFDALAAVDPGREDEALRVALGLKEGERVWIPRSTHQGEEGDLVAGYRGRV